jgi:hypothetical protein
MPYDFARLKNVLLRSNLQAKDPSLYQVLDQLIKGLIDLQHVIDELESDITVVSQSGTGGAISSEWSVLTNGDPVTPELIFADGDVIMVSV